MFSKKSAAKKATVERVEKKSVKREARKRLRKDLAAVIREAPYPRLTVRDDVARCLDGRKVRLVCDAFATEEVGTLILPHGRFTREGTYGTWTIVREDGSRYRNEGRLYLMHGATELGPDAPCGNAP